MHHYIAFLSTATRKTSGASFPYRRFSCFLSFHFRSSWVLASSAGCQGDGFLISHHCEQLLQFSLRSNTSALTVRSIISWRLFQFYLCVTSSRSVSYLVVKVRNIRVMTRLRHYLVPGLTVIPALHFIPRWLQPVVIRTKAKAAIEGIVICGFVFFFCFYFSSFDLSGSTMVFFQPKKATDFKLQKTWKRTRTWLLEIIRPRSLKAKLSHAFPPIITCCTKSPCIFTMSSVYFL